MLTFIIGIVDVLRRAGVEVLVAGLESSGNIKGANGIEIKAELALSSIDINSLDGIALAGGFEGMQNLSNNAKILEIIQRLHKDKKIVAAIGIESIPRALYMLGKHTTNLAMFPT